MSKAVWFHCFAGIAGDMAFGSLIDAGASLEEVHAGLRSLGVDGWTIDAEDTQRCGIHATRLKVTADEDQGVERTFTTIHEILDQAPLAPRVYERALKIFTALAEAEGRVHGKPPEKVHFHEVGSIDAIVDVVGTCLALESLGIDHVYASSVANGHGTINAAHGTMPNPAPAVVALLEGAPIHGVNQPFELTTPTGAAILAGLCERFGPMPQFAAITSSGFGAGSRDLEGLPNATQAIVGELSLAETHYADNAGQTTTLLELNVDDATGEVLAYTVEKALATGAHDAWITPIIMKKGRPAYTVSALVNVAKADAIAEVLVTETGSMGLRGQQWQRWPRRRQFDSVTFDQSLIGIKNAAHRHKAEYEDAAQAAKQRRQPVRQVLTEAEAAFERQRALPPKSEPEPEPEKS